MFSQMSVILFTEGGGVADRPLGRHPPGQTPPLWTDTPLTDRHPLGRHPSPGRDHHPWAYTLPLGRHPPGQTSLPPSRDHHLLQTPLSRHPPGQIPLGHTSPLGRHLQWQIQDFPEEGAPTPQGGANIRFCQKFPKTA